MQNYEKNCNQTNFLVANVTTRYKKINAENK